MLTLGPSNQIFGSSFLFIPLFNRTDYGLGVAAMQASMGVYRIDISENSGSDDIENNQN